MGVRSKSCDVDGHGHPQLILRYLKSSKAAFQACMNMGWIMNASRPEHHKKFYAACARPDNVVAWAAPQVDHFQPPRILIA